MVIATKKFLAIGFILFGLLLLFGSIYLAFTPTSTDWTTDPTVPAQTK